MSSVQARIKVLRDALVSVAGDIVFHYFRPQDTDRFVTWMEDGEEDAFDADNHKAEQTIHGTIHFFTNIEFDPLFDAIQDTLDNLNGVTYRWEVTTYEDDTRRIHTTWEWWM